MIVNGVDKLYEKFIDQDDSRWAFGNSVLYRMCQENPYHDREDVVIGKIWLIGRSYAAAIERRKNSDDFIGDEFYFKAVAPKMLEIGNELDRRLEIISESNGTINDVQENILSTHKFLMDAFLDITGLEKRSLASKYLHFHCPEKFFIYDSRAKNAIGKYVKRADINVLSRLDDSTYDKEYAVFVCKMLELQQYIDEELGLYESPRKLDSFLLSNLTANKNAGGGASKFDEILHLEDQFNKDNYGKWIIDNQHKGTIDDPIHFPYVDYSDTVRKFIKAVYHFEERNKDYELTRYNEILEEHGYVDVDFETVDVTGMDDKCLMALFMMLVRADRFCEGIILRAFETGVVFRWLERLRELNKL